MAKPAAIASYGASGGVVMDMLPSRPADPALASHHQESSEHYLLRLSKVTFQCHESQCILGIVVLTPQLSGCVWRTKETRRKQRFAVRSQRPTFENLRTEGFNILLDLEISGHAKNVSDDNSSNINGNSRLGTIRTYLCLQPDSVGQYYYLSVADRREETPFQMVL